MDHVIEPASSGRAKCRGCGKTIPKGELRLGEREENPFGDGLMTMWFHLSCAAYKRPEPLLEVLDASDEDPPDGPALRRVAEQGIAHRRLPRIAGAQRSPTGRAACRSCHEKIPKDVWRIQLVFFEDGRFNPAGNLHVGCAAAYFETRDILDRIARFTPELSEADLGELAAELGAQEA